jgi:hypothetical protein
MTRFHISCTYDQMDSPFYMTVPQRLEYCSEACAMTCGTMSKNDASCTFSHVFFFSVHSHIQMGQKKIQNVLK